MTISVLMSVYAKERAEYLDRALCSVWDEQTLRPDCIVIVEDGPLGDELMNTIVTWKDKLGDVLRVLRNDVNRGLTYSLNKGVGVIDTDLIARMDSDDISVPSRFADQVRFLQEHPDISIVGGAIEEFNDEEGIVGHRAYPTSDYDVRRYIKKASPLAHPAVMMRREVFDLVRYDEHYRTSQDIALWFDALANGFMIANLSSVVLRFRRDNDVYKRRSRKKAWNEFRIYMGGIRKLEGLFTLSYVYPISRLLFRLLPQSIVRTVYNSRLRTALLNKD